MRSAHLRAAPTLLAVALAGCDVTLPWTEEHAGSPTTPTTPTTPTNPGTSSFSVTPSPLLFVAQPGGAKPFAQRMLVSLGKAVEIRATSTGAVASAAVVPDSTSYAHVDVTVAAPTVSGTFDGTVSVTGCADAGCTTQVSGSPAVVPVRYAVASSPSAGGFSVSPASLSFDAQSGAATPAAQRIDVAVGPAADLRVACSPAIASAVLTHDSATAAHVDVSVRPPLGSSTVTGTVAITGCAGAPCTSDVAGSPAVVPVTYTIAPASSATALQADLPSLSFQMVAVGADPAPVTLTLSTAGGVSSRWNSCFATWWAPFTWITWSPSTGTALPADIQVTVHGAGIPAGSQRSGNLRFQTVPCGTSDANAVSVPVTFAVE